MDVLRVRDNEQVDTVGRLSLRAQMENAQVQGAVGDILVFGNQTGYSVLLDRDDLRGEVGRIKEQMKAQNQKLEEQSHKLEELYQRLAVVSSASEGYLKIRSRFIDVFKRDVLGQDFVFDRDTIEAGNKAAHHGDVLTDALLYTRNRRRDERIFLTIYGVSAAGALELGKSILLLHFTKRL